MRRRSPRSTLFPYTTLFRFLVALDGPARYTAECCRGAGFVHIYVATRLAEHFIARLSVGFDADLVGRSEEHTSELQSHSDLVCRLLLEKKKTHATATASQSAR